MTRFGKGKPLTSIVLTNCVRDCNSAIDECLEKVGTPADKLLTETSLECYQQALNGEGQNKTSEPTPRSQKI